MVILHAAKKPTYGWVFALLLLVGVLAGCQGGNNSTAFVSPPAPLQSQYAIVTDNYYDHYNQGLGSPPFSAAWQFANEHYPIPVSYLLKTTPPANFNLALETENSVVCWNRADPRICILSRTTADKARIHMILEDDVKLGDQTNILGLTTIESTNVPSFQIEIATRYYTSVDSNGAPIYQYLNAADLKKTVAHELGHTLGLGHSPNARDLMYYQANPTQGNSYTNYVTYGDGMAVWTTLNARSISWQHFQPVTLVSTAPLTVQRSLGAESVPPRGTVVDVYTKQ